MTSREAHEIMAQARLQKVHACRFLFATDQYEVRFSHYSKGCYRRYEAARVFLLSILIESAEMR